ncbi:MAG: ribose-phosphate pyrophosphokinase [Planctomycetes bacterium]|nr:ribose-phosphate pyrophosphokinase [Planctomycetota bacterium]
MKANCQVYSGNAHRGLAESIAQYLGLPLGAAYVGRFPDGEIDVKVEDDVRGGECFVVQPTCPPVNENLMELLVLLDCLRRASAASITAVIPYFGYARKDRKDEGRVPITAKLVANLLEAAGVTRVVTVDLHAPQIQGFFDIPVDHLYAQPVLIRHFQAYASQDIVLACPDVGGMKLIRNWAKQLDASMAVVDKRRHGPDEVETGRIIGDVRDRIAILVDDMIATGGSIVKAADAVLAAGAREVHVCATHPVMAGEAHRRIEESRISRVVVTDSIPLAPAQCGPGSKIEVASLARLLGEAIKRIYHKDSVSSLFALDGFIP